jgi:hypothetical protein
MRISNDSDIDVDNGEADVAVGVEVGLITLLAGEDGP